MTASALPPPARTSLAARVALLAGGIALLVAVAVALTGLMRGTLYDTGARGPAAGVAAKSELDLFGNVSAIDRNVKHLRDRTGAQDDAYGGNLAAINAAEAEIPSLAQSTEQLLANVRALDRALAQVSAANTRLNGKMADLTNLQTQAAASLGRLGGQTSGLVALMSTLGAATAGLESRLARIQGAAHTIGHDKLPPAVATTNRLNDLLPARIPPRRLEPIR